MSLVPPKCSAGASPHSIQIKILIRLPSFLRPGTCGIDHSDHILCGKCSCRLSKPIFSKNAGTYKREYLRDSHLRFVYTRLHKFYLNFDPERFIDRQRLDLRQNALEVTCSAHPITRPSSSSTKSPECFHRSCSATRQHPSRSAKWLISLCNSGTSGTRLTNHFRTSPLP